MKEPNESEVSPISHVVAAVSTKTSSDSPVVPAADPNEAAEAASIVPRTRPFSIWDVLRDRRVQIGAAAVGAILIVLVIALSLRGGSKPAAAADKASGADQASGLDKASEPTSPDKPSASDPAPTAGSAAAAATTPPEPAKHASATHKSPSKSATSSHHSSKRPKPKTLF